VQYDDAEHSTLSFLRRSRSGETVLVALNLTPVPRHGHTLGVPVGGRWDEVLNSDAETYGGSGVGNLGAVSAVDAEWGGFPHRVEVTLPPLSLVAFKAAT
jgi:1,4-alpha-glucan branching enzyme